uniref:Dynein heavy chain linker domain-containing protein n=1 Tax=Amphimedon queenslandica TaxID=400682 RepID=A0A1X7TDN3_AMPQE
VREQWLMYELDLINYQNKWKLIKGWDDLFTKVKEHINSVTTMKLSPFFKINAIFDIWIDKVSMRKVFGEEGFDEVFYEEELDVPLVLFNESHLLLIGVSGAGKTTLSRFVAWINGLSVFEIK